MFMLHVVFKGHLGEWSGNINHLRFCLILLDREDVSCGLSTHLNMQGPRQQGQLSSCSIGTGELGVAEMVWEAQGLAARFDCLTAEPSHLGKVP